MTLSIRRLSLLTVLFSVLLAPAAAQAKYNPNASYKRLAKSINQAHTQWTEMRGPAVYRARQAGAQVAAKCMPAMEAAGKDTEHYDAAGMLGLGYSAVQNGAINSKTAPLRLSMAEANMDARLPMRNTWEGLATWSNMAASLDGFYMTVDELCEAANQWQSDGFKIEDQPAALSRAWGAYLGYAYSGSEKSLMRLEVKLRRGGATRLALDHWANAYIVDNKTQFDEPVMKALFPDTSGEEQLQSLLHR